MDQQRRLFLRAFLENPGTVSSVIPSSQAVVRKVCSLIDDTRRVVVEYGPGTGVVPRELLKQGKLAPDARLILIEKVRELADALRCSLADDTRVSVVHGSAEHADEILARYGEGHADAVLCSAPLTVMRRETRDRILRVTHDLLADNGVFIVYLARRRIQRDLEKVFAHVSRSFVPWNFPPLSVYECHKNGQAR